jgi:hypothetical protein
MNENYKGALRKYKTAYQEISLNLAQLVTVLTPELFSDNILFEAD